MAMSVCSTTSAHAYQVAQQQLSSERRETVENDNDGDDSLAVAKTRQAQDNQQSSTTQAQTAPQARDANKGQNVDYYA